MNAMYGNPLEPSVITSGNQWLQLGQQNQAGLPSFTERSVWRTITMDAQ